MIVIMALYYMASLACYKHCYNHTYYAYNMIKKPYHYITLTILIITIIISLLYLFKDAAVKKNRYKRSGDK